MKPPPAIRYSSLIYMGGNRALPGNAKFAISFGLMKPCSLFCAAVLGIAVLGGCSGKPQGRGLPEPPRVANCEPGVPGGRLILTVTGNPHTFNPLLDEPNDAASDSVRRLLFSSLVAINLEKQEPEPGLAESWSVAADQKTWTFKLRKNLRWSDGEPLTADDVVFTWNEVMYNPKYNQGTYELFQSGGKKFEVTKVDDLTVRVVTPEVFAPFLDFFGTMNILPRHTLGRWAASGDFLHAYAVTDRPENIVGSGPFRLKSFQAGNSVLLERNPEYWAVDKKGQRLPYFDEVEIRILPPGTGNDVAFFQASSAVCENIPLTEIDRFQSAAAGGNFKVVDLGVGVQRDFLWFNLNPGVDRSGKPFVDPVKLKWFGDKRFREAISCALNRERIIHDVYDGRAQAVYGFLSTDNKKWNNPSIPQYSYNPNQARALLAGMGLTNRPSDGGLQDAGGHLVAFTLMSSYENPIRNAIAARVQQDLNQFGIRVTYVPMKFGTLTDHLNNSDYECASMGFGGGGLEPATQMNVLKSDAPLHQWFPSQRAPATDWEKRIDALMDSQMHTLDFAQRKKYFDEVQAIWADEMPMICIAAPSSAAAIRNNIGNARPAIATSYHVTWNIEELYFKK